MSEPATEAGRRHLLKHIAIVSCQPSLDAAIHRFVREDIAAIEAEACEQERERIWAACRERMRLEELPMLLQIINAKGERS